MAAEATEETKKQETPSKNKNKKLLLIAIAAVVAVIISGVVVKFVFLGKPGPDKGKVEAKAEGAEAKGEKGDKGDKDKGGPNSGAIVNLEPFIVNLQDNSGTRYLKLTVNLELDPSSNSTEITAQTPQIRDALIVLLSSKSYADIGTIEGKYQLRDEIITRINQFLSKSKVRTAYFTEFVIQ